MSRSGWIKKTSRNPSIWIFAEFENVKTKPVRPAELKRAREYAVGTSRMALERTSSQNMRLGGSVLVYGTSSILRRFITSCAR